MFHRVCSERICRTGTPGRPRGRLYHLQLPPAHHRRLLSGGLPQRKLYGSALPQRCPRRDDENHQGNRLRIRRGVKERLQEEGSGREGVESTVK